MNKLLIALWLNFISVVALASSNWTCEYDYRGRNRVVIEYRTDGSGKIVLVARHSNSNNRSTNYTFAALGPEVRATNNGHFSPMRNWTTIEIFSTLNKRHYHLDLLANSISIFNESKDTAFLEGASMNCAYNIGGE